MLDQIAVTMMTGDLKDRLRTKTPQKKDFHVKITFYYYIEVVYNVYFSEII